MIYKQNIFKGELRVSDGVSTFNTINENGTYSDNSGIVVSKNEPINDEILENLIKKNYFTNKDIIEFLNIHFLKINNEASKKQIRFSAIVKQQTEHISIMNKEEVESYRQSGYCRLVFSCDRNINYKDILLNDEKSIMIKEIDSIYSNMMDSILKKKNTTIHNIENSIMSVIFAPGVGGYFIHEVLGHMVEGDYVSNKMSLFGTKYNLNDVIADRELNVVDDVKGFSQYIGISNIDDEGKKTKKIQIVKNGTLNGYICDSESADMLKNDSFSGCARRQSYLFKAIPRMRATYIEPSTNDIKLSNLIQETEDGILIDNIIMGQANPLDGKFMLFGSGYIIKDGKKKYIADKIVISDEIINSLNSINFIGNDLSVLPVQCGKSGQFVPVCVGSPSIKISNMKILGGCYGK